MTNRWHIDRNGEPAKCDAKTPASCRAQPMGGGEIKHFDNLSAALAESSRVLQEEYGPATGRPVTRGELRNRDILANAFAKLNSTLAFEEGESGGVKCYTAHGERYDYEIKVAANGRAFVYRQRNGNPVGVPQWFESFEEAKKEAERSEN